VLVFYYSPKTSQKYPAPAVQITVYSSRDRLLWQNVEAILDTGSAATCIPESIIPLLGGDLLPYDVKRVLSATGPAQQVKRYLVDLTIGRCPFNKIYVVALQRPYALIGRDIANDHLLALAAKMSVWSISSC
jgi:hypothetical protein